MKLSRYAEKLERAGYEIKIHQIDALGLWDIVVFYDGNQSTSNFIPVDGEVTDLITENHGKLDEALALAVEELKEIIDLRRDAITPES